MTTNENILFDFDGTLVDSSEGIYRAFTKSCSKIKATCPGSDVFKELIGPPIRQIAATCFPFISNYELDAFEKCFRNYYDSVDFSYVKWYPGVIEWLSSNCGHASSIYVVTNKPTMITKSIISLAGIDDCFAEIIGIDYRIVNATGTLFKDKSEAIDSLLTSAKIDPYTTLYIGDTPSDLQSCLKNKVKFVAATYGFHNWSSHEIGGNLRASSFTEVVDIIRNFNNKYTIT